MPTTPALFENPAAQNGEGTAEDDTDNHKHVRRVGWIPEEWDAVALGELLSLSNGKSRPDDLRNKRTGEHTMPVFDGNGVMGYARKQLVEGPRIIIGRVGALCGVVHLAEGEYWVSDNAMYTQNLEALEIPPRFLWYLLDFSDLGRYRQESSQPLITQRIVKQKKVPLPPPQEQVRIAKILGTWNRAIEQVDALIEKKEERLHGLRQRLLTGEVRFPDCIESEEMKEVDIGEVPADWTQERLGDLFTWKTDKNEDNVIDKVITVGKDEICDQEEHFNRSVASDDLSNYRIIEPGDFVYDPMSAYYGALGRYDLEETGVVSPAYRVLQLNDGYHSDFVKFLLQSHYVLFRIDASSLQNNKSGKRRGLRQDAFASIQVHIPPVEEQRRIAKVLDTAETEIQQLKEKRDALKRQKKGLMQRLLTGAVRTV